MAAGDLTDGAPHAAREGAVFCIPATASGRDRPPGTGGHEPPGHRADRSDPDPV